MLQTDVYINEMIDQVAMRGRSGVILGSHDVFSECEEFIISASKVCHEFYFVSTGGKFAVFRHETTSAFFCFRWIAVGVLVVFASCLCLRTPGWGVFSSPATVFRPSWSGQ